MWVRPFVLWVVRSVFAQPSKWALVAISYGVSQQQLPNASREHPATAGSRGERSVEGGRSLDGFSDGSFSDSSQCAEPVLGGMGCR